MIAPEMTDDGKLAQLARIAAALGATSLSADADVLAARVAEGRFYVACVGQFKRGKSTLLNALVGHSVLPAAIVPVTAIPTVLRYGTELRAHVRFIGGRGSDIDVAALESFVSEERNPGNVQSVETVEVFVPSPLLTDGMCLVDTPGVGSVFTGNTATTRAFIPQIDAALIVIGADPPISGEELSLAEQVVRAVPHVMFILNKADRFTAAECAEAVAFTTRILMQRLHRAPGTVYAVSALQQMAHSGPPRDWPALVAALRALAHESGRGIVRAAAARGVARIADACLREVDIALRALRDPLEQSDRRLAALQAYIADVEHHVPRLQALIAIERQQLARTLEQRREAFLAIAVPQGRAELRTRMPGSRAAGSAALRDDAFALARHVAQEHLAPWFADEERSAEQLYRGVASRYADLANTFLAQIAAANDHTVDDLDAVAMDGFDLDLGFTKESRFYFHDAEPLVRTASPWPRILDLVRPRALVQRDIEQRGEWYLEQLLRINSTRAHNDIDDRVLESGRRLEARIRSFLADLSASAQRYVERARAAHAAGAERVASEIHRLEELRRDVIAVRAAGNGEPD